MRQLFFLRSSSWSDAAERRGGGLKKKSRFFICKIAKTGIGSESCEQKILGKKTWGVVWRYTLLCDSVRSLARSKGIKESASCSLGGWSAKAN